MRAPAETKNAVVSPGRATASFPGGLWLSLLSAVAFLFLHVPAPAASLLVEGDLRLLPALGRAGLLEGRPTLFFSAYQKPSDLSRLITLVDLVVLDQGNRLGPFLKERSPERPKVVRLDLLGSPGCPSVEDVRRALETKDRERAGLLSMATLKVSPARYKVSVEDRGGRGFWVVLGESFHPSWNAWVRRTYTPSAPEPSSALLAWWRDRKRRVEIRDHFLANGFANAWFVGPGKPGRRIDIILEFGHQAPFEAGAWAVLFLFLVLLAAGGIRTFHQVLKKRGARGAGPGRTFPPWNSRALLWAAPLILLGLFHAFRFFSGGYPLGHDLLASLSLSRYLDHQVNAGWFLSTWNEQSYGGYPLYSVFPSSFPVFIHLLGGLAGSRVLAVKLFFFFAFYLASIPAFLLARTLGFSWKGALAAAVLYTLLPIHFLEGVIEGHGLVLVTFFLAPLWAWCALRYLRSPGNLGWWYLAAGLVTYLLVGGHPQYPFFFHPLLLAAVLGAGFLGWNRSIPPGKFLKKALLLALLVIPAFALDPGWWELLLHKSVHVASFNSTGSVPLSFAAPADRLLMFRMDGCCLGRYPAADLFFLPAWAVFWVLAAGKVRERREAGIPVWGGVLLASFLLSLGVATPFFPFLFRNGGALFQAIRTPGRFLVPAAVFAIPFFAAVFSGNGRWRTWLFLLLVLSFLPEASQAFLTFPLDRKALEGEIVETFRAGPSSYVEKLPWDYCDGMRVGGNWKSSISPFYLSGGRFRTLGGAEPAQALTTNHILEEFRKGAWKNPAFLEWVGRLIPLKGILVLAGKEGFLEGERWADPTGRELGLLARKYRLFRLRAGAPPHVYLD